MRRRLDLIRAKKSDKANVTLELDTSKQLDAIEKVYTSLERLYELLDGKQDFDFERLVAQLETLNDKLNLADELNQLQASIRELKLPEIPKDMKIKGIDEVIERIQKINTPLDLETISGVGITTGINTTNIIPAQTGARLVITDIIIANSSDIDVNVDIKEGQTIKLTYPAPYKGGSIHALQKPLKLTANTALNFASTMAVTSIKVSALGYITK